MMRWLSVLLKVLLVPFWILWWLGFLVYRSLVRGKRKAVLTGYEKQKAGDRTGAAEAFTRALELDPRYVPALVGRAEARMGSGDREGARADLTQAIELQPHKVDLRWMRADCLEPQDAITDYTAILALRPNDVRAYRARAARRAVSGDVAGALEDYAAAIQLKPEDSEAWQARGDLRAQQGDYAGAIADHDRLLVLRPELTNIVPCNRGVWKLRLGDRPGAVADFSLAIDTHPHSAAEAWYNRGLMRAEDGDLAGAIADYSGTIACYDRLRGLLQGPRSGLMGTVVGDCNRLVGKAYQARAKARQASGDEAGAVEDREAARGLKK